MITGIFWIAMRIDCLPTFLESQPYIVIIGLIQLGNVSQVFMLQEESVVVYEPVITERIEN